MGGFLILVKWQQVPGAALTLRTLSEPACAEANLLFTRDVPVPPAP